MLRCLSETSLTTWLCTAKENVPQSGEITQRTTMRYQRMFKVTIPTSNKNQQKKIVFSKVSDSRPLSDKCCLRVAFSLQTLTTRPLKKYKPGNKNSSKKTAFSRYIISENSTKRLFTQPQGHMMTKVIKRPTLQAFFHVLEVAVVLSQWAKNN